MDEYIANDLPVNAFDTPAPYFNSATAASTFCAVRVEAFNRFNTPQFNNPAMGVGANRGGHLLGKVEADMPAGIAQPPTGNEICISKVG